MFIKQCQPRVLVLLLLLLLLLFHLQKPHMIFFCPAYCLSLLRISFDCVEQTNAQSVINLQRHFALRCLTTTMTMIDGHVNWTVTGKVPHCLCYSYKPLPTRATLDGFLSWQFNKPCYFNLANAFGRNSRSRRLVPFHSVLAAPALDCVTQKWHKSLDASFCFWVKENVGFALIMVAWRPD